MTEGPASETGDREGHAVDDVPGGADGDHASGTDGGDGDGGLRRRDVLAGGGALALGAGLAYWLVSDGDGGGSGPDSNLPFSVWEEMRAGLRDSPDHLPGTAEDLVAEGDPEALFRFVRDEVATQPPAPFETNSSPFTTGVNGGPRAALRSGMGTPREKAELLARLLDRAGYEAEVLQYERALAESQLRELFFGAVTHEFDPGFDQEQLTEWRRRLGVANGEGEESLAESLEDTDEDGGGESGGADGSEPAGIDPDGEDSAALGERIRGALSGGSAEGFDWSVPDRVPVVRFWPSPEEDETTDDGGTESPTDGATPTETPTPTPTPTPAETTTGTPAPDEGEVRYADLFHPDESFGSLRSPDAVGPAPETDVSRVIVTLEAAFSDAPTERRELVTAGYDATDLAGRQLLVDTLPGISPFDYPTVRHSDVNRFIPALTVQDPHAEGETLESLSLHGDPFSVTGDRYIVDSQGNVRRNGTVVDEGERETTFTLVLPDGTEREIEPVERPQSIGEYYTYTDNTADSDIEDEVERVGETVTYVYRDTTTGEFSLVVVHDHPTEGKGGKVRMTFDGVTGARWVQLDDPLDGNDNYGTPKSTFGDTEWANWQWSSAHTDGGAIGGLGFPFDVGMTSHGQHPEWPRQNLERWVFLEGDDLDPVEVAEFDQDNPEDVTLRVQGEISEPDPTGGPEAPDDLSDVADVSVSVDPGSHPEVSVAVGPTDADGREVEDLPGTAFEVAEDGERVVAELQERGPPYEFTYRSPNEREVGAERSVSVTMQGAGVEDTATYTVPASSTDPRSETGLCGLYLTVEMDGDVSRRTLAGWDPELDGDREPTDADRNEALSALFGNHVLTFESAGVPPSVYLDDRLTGQLTLEPHIDAGESGSHEEVKEAVRDGMTAVERFPQYFHPRLPDRTTEDTITYGTGLRTVLFGRRPEFGTDEVELSVDLLDTSTIRTLTRSDDREREFRLTMDRTARWAVLERDNLDRSTASLLADATLVRPNDFGLENQWSNDIIQQFRVARSRRSLSNGPQVVAEAGDTAAFWHVNRSTGAVTGVLPDGSGGGDRVAEIKEQLEQINRMADAMGLYLDAASALGVATGAAGMVAQYYGKLLAKLYAIASIAIATMDASQLQEEARQAIATFACNMALNMGLEWAAGSLGEIITTANSVSGAMGGETFGC